MKRLAISSLALLLLNAAAAQRSDAQYLGQVGLQTVAAQPFGTTATACTGALQIAVVPNLGQVSHYVNYSTPTPPVGIQVQLIGSNGATGGVFSDTATSTPSGQLQGTGYYSQVFVAVTCATASGNFIVNYSGTNATPLPPQGLNLQSVISKSLTVGLTMGSSSAAIRIPSPFGTSLGLLVFQPSIAPPAGSTITVACDLVTALYTTFTFPLSTSIGNTNQTFNVPATPCLTPQVLYNSGGASAGTYNLFYEYYPPGTGATASATAGSIGSTTSNGATIVEKGGRWSTTSTPAAGSQSTASRAAGTGTLRHVADCVTVSAGAATAPGAATILTINLRDGATGVGTILWQTTIAAPAATGQHGTVYFCGLNLIGSVTTAMTLEFSASLGNEQESVTLTGYDVQ